jgi:LysR family cys regulon transcriptional activator
LPYVERLLQEADNIRRASDELQGREDGRLSVAATHSQARYVLPPVVKEFRQRYPRVSLHLHQGSPQQIAQMLLSGEADIGVATEALASYEQLATLPCYRWTHNLVVLPGHPLLAPDGACHFAGSGQVPPDHL